MAHLPNQPGGGFGTAASVATPACPPRSVRGLVHGVEPAQESLAQGFGERPVRPLPPGGRTPRRTSSAPPPMGSPSRPHSTVWKRTGLRRPHWRAGKPSPECPLELCVKVDRALGLLNQALTIDKPRPVPGPEAWWKNTVEYSVDCFGWDPRSLILHRERHQRAASRRPSRLT